MNEELLRTVVAEGVTREIPQGTRRDVAIPKLAQRASVLKGVRRCGKTYRMFQQIHELMDAGVAREQVLFVDFEDDRLSFYPDNVIGAVVEEYLRLVPAAVQGKAYLFFDEVQNVEGWGRTLRRLTQDPRFEICVSGSSAKMLSDDIATEFRGRGIAADVYPYSFREYLRHRRMEPSGVLSPDDERVLRRAFEEYLSTGGFPEVQDADTATRVAGLQDVVQTVVARDLAERHGLPVLGARRFVQRALRCSGREYSTNKIYNELRSMGVSLAKGDAYELPVHCEDAYLFFLVARFGADMAQAQMGKRKLYAVDPGLSFAMGPAGSADLGQRLETAVYLELRRRLLGDRLSNIGFYQTPAGYEIDFVVGDEEERVPRFLYQVSAFVEEPSTFHRECRALTDAMDATGLERGELIALDATSMPRPEDPRIHIVEAWRWMLGLE